MMQVRKQWVEGCCAVLWPSTIGGRGHAVAQVVEALCYKSEGCGFDSR